MAVFGPNGDPLQFHFAVIERSYPGRTDALLVQYREVVTALIVQPVEFDFLADLLFVAEHDDTNGKACIQILWIRCFVYGRDKQCSRPSTKQAVFLKLSHDSSKT